MLFRCPYCGCDLGAQAKTRCPACDKVMRAPESATWGERVARRRHLNQVRRQTELNATPAKTLFDARILNRPRVLLPVVLLLAVLGSLVLAGSKRAPQAVEPPHRKALRELSVLATALGRYRVHVGQYPAPAPDFGLAALIHNDGAPGWNGPYVSLLHADPWFSLYRYERQSNDTVRLYSIGPDRTPGTPDDLHADPQAFEVGTDWTNGWLNALDRLPGVLVLPGPGGNAE